MQIIKTVLIKPLLNYPIDSILYIDLHNMDSNNVLIGFIRDSHKTILHTIKYPNFNHVEYLRILSDPFKVDKLDFDILYRNLENGTLPALVEEDLKAIFGLKK